MTRARPPTLDSLVESSPPVIDHAHEDLVWLKSHDLSDALSSIVGSAELIDSGDLTDDQRRLFAGILLRKAGRLSALVNTALALQRLETGHRELSLAPVDLGSLIERAASNAGEDDERPIEVRIPTQLPLVSAEAEAILEVLTNFLSNARRFSPDGGAIRISARAIADKVEVSIVDHGIGIEAESLPKVFHKFYRADRGVGRHTPGAGLGLAITHTMVEAHGGRVGATSRGLGKGARFWFTLPIARPDATPADVLIVDDEAWFAGILKAEFAAKGLRTVRVTDAETAERLLVDMTPRAIVLDLGLPSRQGEDFLARMVASGGKRIPAVVLTEKNLEPDEISALESEGAIAVLPREAGAPEAAVTLIAEALALDGVGE
ncbi:MAG TPA: ATP-binding protein [Candidatus Dormibacteraeota bacterium]